MSESGQQKPLDASILQAPIEEFSAYCEAEFERRRNGDEPFDETAYREAMELVLSKLRAATEKEQG
jgi:predicted secreted protein